MDYHLNQQGQTVGVFPLEELRRRRNYGELTGTELVWCQGMVEWQTLDTVLQRESPGDSHAPHSLPKPESKLIPNLMMAGVVLGGVIGLVFIGSVIFYRIHGIPTALRQAVSKVERPVRFGRSSALAEASKPIHWTTNTLTAVQMLARQREFRIRQYLELYKKYGDRKLAYDADARMMIEMWIDTSYGGPLRTSNAVVVAMCDKLAANPACDDPLVLTVTAANELEMHEAVRRLDRALKGYEHSQYKAYPRLYATVTLAAKLTDLRRDSRRVAELDFSAKRLLKEALQDGSIQPEDQADFADILIDGWGSGFVQRNGATLPSIVEAAGDRFQWLAFMLEGEQQIDAAWHARGGGYVDTVSQEGWRGFREHMARARASFTKAWALRPDLPFAAARMIYVSLGDSDLHEMRLWFDRTVALQIDFQGAWTQLRWGLRPRWYGDVDSMLALGVAAANTRRYDTDVPRKLYDSIYDVEQELELPPGQHIYGRADVWPHLQEMYDGYLAEPSRVSERNGWRNAYATIAFIGEKYDVARTQLEALNWQVDGQHFMGWGCDLTLMPLEVAARTGAARKQVDVAEAASHDAALGQALRIYTQLNTETNLDERTQSYVQERLTTLTTEQRLEKGEWIDFLPTEEKLTGWAVERGQCTAMPDGSLVVQSDQGGHIIYSRTRVGTDFEIRGTFDVVQSSTGAFQAGVVMGMPHFGSYGWYGFRIKRNPDDGDIASFAEGWSTRQIHKLVTLNNDTNTFYLRFQHGLVTVRVNDEQVFKDAKAPQNWSVPTTDSLVGLGAFNDMNDTVIRYRNVQIRKL
jgi:hypothetical protein